MSVFQTLDELKVALLETYQTNMKLIELADLLKRYQGTDWQSFIQYEKETYHRQLIYRNSSFDLLILTWKQGQKTKIHDHPSQGCLMKVLQGELQENLYQNGQPITQIGSRLLKQGEIGYKENNLIIHDIYAPVDSVSLHLY